MTQPHQVSTAQYRPYFQFSHAQLVEILDLQYSANDSMAGDWTKHDLFTLPFFRASYIEAVEAIQHHGFKWWKNKTSDVPQMKMELIDILHFALSDLLRSSGYDTETAALREEAAAFESVTFYSIGRHAGKSFDGDNTTPSPEGSNNYLLGDIHTMDFNDLCEQLIFDCLMEGSTSTRLLYCLFERVDLGADEVHALFVGKNALNQFRTSNGQKADDYFKIWDGREDNEHLSAFIESQLSASIPISYQDVYTFLTERYASTQEFEKK